MCSAIKNWSYPFEGENKDPFLELTKLAKATGGFYPMGSNGLWHGGIHLDDVTHPTLSAGVRCIADGEVIAYRLDAQYPVSAYQSESRCTPAPFSTSFVLVKHRLMPPASEANTGTPPVLVFYSLYMHLQDWAGYQSNPSLPRPTFWSDTIHRVDTQGSNLNLRAQARTDSAILASLPNGTRVKVASGKGDFCKLLEILDDSASPRLSPDANGQLPGYLAARFLRADERLPSTDQVIVLEQPVAITAGALVGYPGVYQNHNSAGKPLLHLEVFSCEDVPVYLQQSRSWADAHLPDRQKTQLKVYAGASKLIANHSGISASTPPQLSDPGTVVGVDLIIPQSYLDTLPAERKISVKTPQGVTRWWHLDKLLADAQGQPISGWLAEQELITTRHSPWEWEGFECIEDSEPPKEGLAYYLNALHRLIDSELASYQGLVDQSDKGSIKSRLYDIIDANRDGKITPAEIRAALAKPWHAQSISQLITRHESEWFWNPEKWNALDDLLGHSPSDPNPAWATEKERIQKLCWWSDLAGKHGICGDGKVWHFHPLRETLKKTS